MCEREYKSRKILYLRFAKSKTDSLTSFRTVGKHSQKIITLVTSNRNISTFSKRSTRIKTQSVLRVTEVIIGIEAKNLYELLLQSNDNTSKQSAFLLEGYQKSIKNVIDLMLHLKDRLYE